MLFALDGCVAAAHELMTVGSNESEAVGEEVEIDTVHYRADLIVVRSEDRASDIVAKHLGTDSDRLGILSDRRFLRIFLSILCCEVVTAILIFDSYLVSLRIDLEGQGARGAP